MATSPVHVALPQSSLFRFPPSPQPATLSPPTSDFTLARPFNIPEDWYNLLLQTQVPVTFALFYAFSAAVGNRMNQERGWKPWTFSHTSLFFCFVVVHNVFLAAFSAWTFVGMANAARQSWPGWENEHGLVGVVDSLCKINGPRGLGSAATYNVNTESWGIADPAMKLLNNLPDSTDVGRIWNEGLAFYGWLFYASKFYEVVDTLILFTKGKKSSFLQMFHHAGAMLCMWAGIRYMSPPIWMFVFVNSGIHGLMYTYYAISAFNVRIPPIVKQTITTLQIAQFIFGASYAVAHLFISYDAPISVPYLFTHNLSTALSSLPTSASSAIASATASAGLGNLLKKVALRAAGEEGLAENVRNKFGETFGIDAVKAVEVERAQEEIRYRMDSVRVHCIDTTGEAFAIWLNLLYLAPLTMLFFRYFVRSYKARSSQNSAPRRVQQAGHDASRDVKDEMKDSTALGNNNEDMDPPTDVKAKLAAATERVKSAEAVLGDKVSSVSNKVGELYEQGKERLQEIHSNHVDTSSDQAEDGEDHADLTRDHADGSSNHDDEDGNAQPDAANSDQQEGVSNEDYPAEAKEDNFKKPEEEDTEIPKEEGDEKPKEEGVDNIKEENGDVANGEDVDSSIVDLGDAQAYEATIDEVKDEADDQAEKEMQPEGI